MSLSQFTFLATYNPWWTSGATAFAGVPAYRRDVFDALYGDVKTLPQMISVTGPRRVGKSTLLRQCIQQLIADAGEAGVDQARRIVYFSLDDPILSLPGADTDKFFNDFVSAAATLATEGPVYLFLDEIQRFPRWELYLKKYYDLKTPVRFVVSGSASGPIFRKSRESLLGRIRDYKLLPFTFNEYSEARLQEMLSSPVDDLVAMNAAFPHLQLKVQRLEAGSRFQTEKPTDLVDWIRTHFGVADVLEGEFEEINAELIRYFYDGGFPEVWQLPTPLAKQEYLYQNQVERVIFEDLLVAAEFRKPEMLRRFYLGLLTDPGRESNLARVGSEIELDRRTIEGYFPLLEATDLVWRLHKFTGSKATSKAGNFKTYIVDLAVRNAVMKLSQEAMRADDTLMGKYAENVVANHLRRWPGLIELAYFRKGNDELDFVVDLGHSRIGVEVKFRNQIDDRSLRQAASVAKDIGCDGLVVVTKAMTHSDWAAQQSDLLKIPIAAAPLAAFLMLF